MLLMALVVAVIAAAWYKHRLNKHGDEANGATKGEPSSSAIWDDEALLKHRVDMAQITRVSCLASGAFGDVWLATYLSEPVALKQLKQDHQHDRDAIKHFVNEIKLMTSFEHPKVVQFIGVAWTKEADVLMLTEYMANGDLRCYLDETTKVDDGWDAQMVGIALDVTEAIVYLHSLDTPLIHRDLKSRNILLDNNMGAKLSDFGVSRYRADDTTMTAGVGTVRWIAPEVLAGKRYDEKVDVYSLGLILSEIDTHEIPYSDAKNEENEPLMEVAIADLVLHGSLTSSFSDSCPVEIMQLSRKCTAFDPTERPSALQVAFELRKLMKQLEDPYGSDVMKRLSRSIRLTDSTVESVESVKSTEDVAQAVDMVV